MGRFPIIEGARFFGAAGQSAFTAPWVTFPGSRAPLLYKDGDGLVHMEGLILNNNGAVAVNDPIASALPASYIPSSTLFFPGNGMYITNTGQLFSNTAGAAGAVVLNLAFVYRPI